MEPRPSMNAQTIKKIIGEIIFSLVPAILIAFFINYFITEAAVVEQGPSMQPNLYVGYRVMTEKVSYRFHEPDRGDIVIVEQEGQAVDLVKRIVALPGEIIEVRAGHVWLNGEKLSEPYVKELGGPSYGPSRIPDGTVFILGDNRRLSHDSRAFGPVSLDAVNRRVIFIYWPLEEFKIFP
jgi:signal peptidase I